MHHHRDANLWRMFFTESHLQSVCRETRRVHGVIVDSMDGLPIAGEHQLIACRLHKVALSHLWSIALLFDYMKPASAFALLRSAIETAQRGLYVQRCHSEDLLAAIARDDKNAFGPYGEMLKGIENRTFGYRHRDALIYLWPLLCSFCHGGLKQIERQVDAPDDAAARFSSVDCILALHQTMEFLAHVTYLLIEDLSGSGDRANVFWSRYMFRETF